MPLSIKKNSLQKEQSELLLKITPVLEKFSRIRFHGGTIINFFCSDTFKRYSVDLDGIFTPDKNISHLSKEEISVLINKELKSIRNELLKPINKGKIDITQIRFNTNRNSLTIYGQSYLDKNRTIKAKLALSRGMWVKGLVRRDSMR